MIESSVLIGSSIPKGLNQVKIHKKLKQGDIILTLLPEEKKEALEVADYCRRNKIYLCFSELLYRGSYELCWAFRKKITRAEFYTKDEINEIIGKAGQYYFGRIAIGEIGGVIYWPKSYTINRRAENWENLPKVETVSQAEKEYISYCKKWIDYEKKELGKGPLLDVDSSMLFKYHALAGIDILCLEMMPGDPQLMLAAIRGTAKAFNKKWGVHIAMACYGGVSFDEIYKKRWKTAFLLSYISGANFIYPESGHYGYSNYRGQNYTFKSQQMKQIRMTIREIWQFAQVHHRPLKGPRVSLGIIHGKNDGTPGLWNRYSWGQYDDNKWMEGSPERGWRFVEKLYRKENWAKESVQGEKDFSGNPPYGQYDVVPIEAPLEKLKQYSCILFLGWNTMNKDIYHKLIDYVKQGGHLFMYLCHLNTQTDRGKALKLYKNGDYSDLFGVKIKGKIKRDVIGVKCGADSGLSTYRFPLWRINTDPRFLGNMTPCKIELTSARIISGWSNFYSYTEEEFKNQPFLVENSLGKGKAYLTAVWEYPGDEGVKSFTEDLIRVIVQGEQGDIKILSSDRIRYAVYGGKKNHIPYNIVYLLNTDPNCSYLANIFLKNKASKEFTVPPNELILAYIFKDIVVVAEQKCIDLKDLKINDNLYHLQFFNVHKQKLWVNNIGKTTLRVKINGKVSSIKPIHCAGIILEKTMDPKRKKFFVNNFLKEPDVVVKNLNLPY